MTSTDEWARFETWCREEASDIHVRAAALGQTVEYAFLRRAEILWKKMGELFPSIGNAMFDSVERACYATSAQPSLDAVNEHRALHGYPPLAAVPPLKMRENYAVPMPGDRPAQ